MEIERKWLIKASKIPYELEKLECLELEQAYISYSPTIRIRKINNGEECYITIKTHPQSISERGLAREEYEIPISLDEYNELIKISRGSIIRKKRYIHKLETGLTEEIDIFSDELEGLAYLEVEFEDIISAKAHRDPEWVERDVTYEYAYKNSALSERGLPEELK